MIKDLSASGDYNMGLFKRKKPPTSLFQRRLREVGMPQQMARSQEQFLQMGQRQPDFTNEQESLRQLFGHGEKIWGWKNRPVEIYQDLCSGDTETSSLFGWGNSRFPNKHETAGLFGF